MKQIMQEFEARLARVEKELAAMKLSRENPRSLEGRLARVEKKLSALKASTGKDRSQPWYRQIVGDFAGDKTFAEIVRLGQLIRRGKVQG
jgi:uncharacterized alpha-E superfamily protein